VAGFDRRVLVTGGAGFVGANLVPRLVDAGHRVRVLDNLSTGSADHLAGVDVDLVTGDIRDEATVDAAMAGVDAVVHLAAAGSVVDSVADPRFNFESNVLGTFRVLDAVRRAGVPRVVLASTGGALIGDATPPVDEMSLPKPISPYGASKLAGEGYAHAFAAAYGIRTVCLRFANVYGPFSERKKGAVTTFFRALHTGAPITIYGDGSASRDYIHAGDICAGLQGGLEGDLPGGTVLHIASGVETSVADLARLCCEAAGRPDHPIVFAEARPGEVTRNFATYTRAAETLGYAPTVQLADGLRACWEWFNRNVFE
jgi:UDP-glucose 4-epimerase